MRFPSILASLLPLSSPAVLGASPHLACAWLSESEISTIAGEAMHESRQQTGSTGPACTYVGERTKLAISFIQAESQSAAIQRFTKELDKAPGSAQSYEPLRGVGAQARYRALDSKDGGVIVARFDTVVVVLSGNLDRGALVELARAVTAHLAESTHSSSEAHRSL